MTTTVARWDVVCEQNPNDPAWHAARALGIGGSDLSAIVGVNRFATARQVWAEKTGRAAPKADTWPMTRGRLLEPGLRDWLARHLGEDVAEMPMIRSVEHPWARYNPDGCVMSDDGPALVECKTTNWWRRAEWEDDQTADHAEVQVQWGLFITGWAKAYVVAAVSDSDPVIREVVADPALQAILFRAAETFWLGNVIGDVEPDATPLDLDDLQGVHSVPGKVAVGDQEVDDLIGVYQRAGERVKDAKKVQDEAKALLLQAIGDAETLVIRGEIAATRAPTERASFVVKASTIHTLRIPKDRKPMKGNNNG